MTPDPLPFLQREYRALQSELDDAYARVMRRGEFILGPELDAFEQEYADYCTVKHCVGVGNGLDALKLVLAALGIGTGDEVIVPGNTFIATLLAVSAVGAVPVPVDPTEDTYTIDPSQVVAALTERTRAIIPVHLFGLPADMAPLREISERHGLMLVEDAAQAHGARYRGRVAGSLARAAAFSFYPVKNLGAFGDAGAVTTDDAALAAALRRLRNYGSTSKYQHEVIGVNSRLDELQAAFLRVKLKVLDAANVARGRIARRYRAALAECQPTLRLPYVPDDATPVWHQFVILCDERDALQQLLGQRSIQALVHYPVPTHRQRAYATLLGGSGSPGALPVTERLARTSLSLPMHPSLAEDEQAKVIETLLEFCAGHRPSTQSRPVKVASVASVSTKKTRLQSYEQEYREDRGFERKLVTARQDLILELLARERPRTVVEVGCGADLLVRRAAAADTFAGRWVIVEPAATFAAAATAARADVPGLAVVEGFVEDTVDEILALTAGPVEMVLLSGLLHEVEEPMVVLQAASRLLSPAGLLHVNVPNAYSLHRRLGQAMHLIGDVHEASDRNRALAQFRLFDADSLRQLLERAGFVIEDAGGHFLKPFTHAQMTDLDAVFTPEMLRGLSRLGRELPALASEIYADARRRS